MGNAKTITIAERDHHSTENRHLRMKKIFSCGTGSLHFIITALALFTMPAAYAAPVTTYGAGLKTCKTYLDARQSDAGEQVAFVDWLSGYFSAVNKTSRHRNNFFGLSDLSHALTWLDDYCSTRSTVPIAAAAGIMLLGAKPGPAAHAPEAISYGSADRSCESYVEARQQRDDTYFEDSAEFTNWLGGYMSGVNAMSFSTNNVLGSAELSDAVSWLETYCNAHPQTAFGAAVDALIVSQQPRLASQPVSSTVR